jgi:uncharacterized protein (TIGR02284 family)
MTNERTVELLNGLIQVCKDSETGFRAAAEAVAVFDLKKALEDFADRRQRFGTELRQQVESLGGQPSGGSLAGALQHGWFNLKALVAGCDVRAVVAECEHGEAAAAQAYAEALLEEWPAALRDTIDRQHEDVREVYERLRSVETLCARL